MTYAHTFNPIHGKAALLAALAGLAASPLAHAQIYEIVSNVPGSFIDISTTGTDVGITGDDQSVNISIAHTNNILNNQTSVWVQSNGTINTQMFTVFGNVCPLPWATAGGFGYAPFWDDLYPPGGGRVYRQDLPDRTIIQWHNIHHFPDTTAGQTIRFQVQLFSSGPILAQFIYDDVVFGGTQAANDYGASASVGVVGPGGTAQFSCNTPALSDGLVLTIRQVAEFGACCLPNGTCVLASAAGCASQNGTYRGDGTQCATANCPMPPGVWLEQGDAGNLVSSAQCTVGNGSLNEIRGANGSTDADLFCIRLCDPSTFSAVTVGGATWDTQLWLFAADGNGIVHNDDEVGGVTLQSRLTSLFTSSLPANTPVYLGITGYNLDPINPAAALIWNNTPFRSERSPDGPGAPGPLAQWTGTGASGTYTIFLTGACYHTPSGPTCYANCDGSTTVPFLNVADFTCFLQRFAAGDPYANCDGSTTPPVLNVADFTCFLQAFAAGCSAP